LKRMSSPKQKLFSHANKDEFKLRTGKVVVIGER